MFITLCSTALVLMTTAASAASLAPSLLEIEAVRGEVVEQSVKIINTEAVEQTYFMGVMKFKASEDGSTPSFVPFDQDHSGLPEWISFPVTEVHVPARSSVDVPFKISVPNDVRSGGYYAGVTVSNAPSDVVATNGAIIDAKTAQLVLLTVKGETRIQTGLLDMTSSLFGNVLTSVHGTIHYRLQNQGNVHVKPVGTIRFTDSLRRIVFQTDANQAEARVLPGSTRTFEVDVKPVHQLLAVGPITVTLDLEDGSGSHQQLSQTFLLIPWSVIGGLLVLVALAIVSRKRTKRS